MKFKTLGLILTLLIIALISYFLITQIVTKVQQKTSSESMVLKIPNFTDKDKLLQQSTPSVFIAFHPECEHCQYEAKSINEKRKDLQDIQFVLFTSASDSATHSFSKTYGLDTLKNIHVVVDSTNEMWRLFDVKTIPTVFIYNAQKQLVKRFNGETKIEAIIKYATPQ